MNTKELYDRINQLPSDLDRPGHGSKFMIAKDSVLELVRQSDEPQKVVVPKFVAEHIEYLRGINSPMRDLYNIAWIDNDQLAQWLYNEPGADDLLGRAWLDGYVVERERRFIVEIPDPEKPNGKKTNLAKFKGKVFLSSTASAAPLTEAEIKRNHEWALPFAREVE